MHQKPLLCVYDKMLMWRLKWLNAVLLVLMAVLLTGANRVTYHGYRVVKVHDAIGEWDDLLQELEDQYSQEDVDIWKHPEVGDATGHIMVSREAWPQFMAATTRRKLPVSTFIYDVQSLITKSDRQNQFHRRQKRRTSRDIGPSVVGIYASHAELCSWMRAVASNYPGLAEVIDLGRTYEGRSMLALKLGRPKEGKLGIWVDGGIHAREWIAPAVIVYMAQKLLEEQEEDAEIASFLEHLDFYLLPVVNPDGYDFCHNKERMWRKNRRPIPRNCTGVDLNRNWGFHWGEDHTQRHPCSNVYPGPRAESEAEVQNIARFILQKAPTMAGFISLHSYTQKWFTRWAYTNESVPPDHQELMDVAARCTRAIQDVNGVEFDAGRAPDLLYAFSGGSPDWARGVAGIKYSYLIELRDKGRYGFLLPPEQIIPSSQEIWAGFRVLFNHIIDKNIKTSTTKCCPSLGSTQGSNDCNSLDSSCYGDDAEAVQGASMPSTVLTSTLHGLHVFTCILIVFML